MLIIDPDEGLKIVLHEAIVIGQLEEKRKAEWFQF